MKNIKQYAVNTFMIKWTECTVAGGALAYPFLAPGSAQYLDMLWNWDSWLSNVALRQSLLENGNAEDSVQALKYAQGCVLNSLNYGCIPIWI